MLGVSAELKTSGLSAQMLLQVHDEIVLECPINELVTTASMVSKVMQNAYNLSVPLKTDARGGPNWYLMEPVENLD